MNDQLYSIYQCYINVSGSSQLVTYCSLQWVGDSTDLVKEQLLHARITHSFQNVTHGL